MRKDKEKNRTFVTVQSFKYRVYEEDLSIRHDLFSFVLIFVLQKPIFMGYYHTLYNRCHGLIISP